MKLTQATVGRKVDYVSRKHAGPGRIDAIKDTKKGPYFQVHDKVRGAKVWVRLSQIALPPKVAK